MRMNCMKSRFMRRMHELHEVAVHAEDDEHLELGVAQEHIALPRLPLSAADTNLAPAFGALCAAGPGDLPAGLRALVRRPQVLLGRGLGQLLASIWEILDQF